MGTSLEVSGIYLVKAGMGQPQFVGRLTSGELLAAIAGQKMTDDRNRQTFDQL